MVFLVLFCHCGECLIHPQDLAIIVQERIRHLKLIQQLLLDNPILGSKIYHLIAHHGFVRQIKRQHDCKIQYAKNRYADPRLPVKAVQRHVHHEN